MSHTFEQAPSAIVYAVSFVDLTDRDPEPDFTLFRSVRGAYDFMIDEMLEYGIEFDGAAPTLQQIEARLGAEVSWTAVLDSGDRLVFITQNRIRD